MIAVSVWATVGLAACVLGVMGANVILYRRASAIEARADALSAELQTREMNLELLRKALHRSEHMEESYRRALVESLECYAALAASVRGVCEDGPQAQEVRDGGDESTESIEGGAGGVHAAAGPAAVRGAARGCGSGQRVPPGDGAASATPGARHAAERLRAVAHAGEAGGI